ncbi:SDR family oxidoreductase [Nordella sp. HKS 07]|uniref:SDR family NAD(P)-dependent oxidoreductase n=1 Tax=Nordella sp. HKS 07 TaxID=2712222 RepID=UPI0013E18F4A|nr:SDR family oxidoreductase [Nordella sp. HKS 07]QIG48043.1 SDR family oxidoreductase [Nordella sp. HKS 07]
MVDKSPFPTVLITGASSGIGEAFAHVAAGEGHPLILVARSEAELHRVRGVVIARYAVPVSVIVLDLGKPGAADTLANELEARKLDADIVINNAGFGLIGKAADLSREEQLRMIDLNVRGLADITLRFLPQMLARGSGGIINVASTAAFMPGPNMAVYFASKAFVVSFTDALYEESKGTGVTLTTLSPGPVETDFQRRAGMKQSRALSKSAMAVAQAGWAGFKAGERLVVPGTMNKLAAYALRAAPRRMILPVIRRAMGAAKDK